MPFLRRAFLLLLIVCTTLASGCKSPTLTVMTFNIRYDTPTDGVNAWPKRRAFVADIIRKHDPDLLGLQEVLVTQRDELLAELPAYESVGVGRDDGDRKGEFSPLFFRKTRFNVIDKGWFWLSETPDRTGSKGWDAACPRIATWARLRDLITKDEVLVLNTHFDHRGDTARRMSAGLVWEFLEKHSSVPRIVLGDFNCDPGQPPHAMIRGMSPEKNRLPVHPPLHDAFSRVIGDETDAGTFNGFEGVRTGPRIDWILHTDEFVPQTCEIVRDSRDGRYPSDHFPVVARFRVTRRR